MRSALFKLTPREIDVAHLLIQGMANKEIAHQLVVEIRTVKAHVAALLRKTGTANRTTAAFVLGHPRLYARAGQLQSVGNTPEARYADIQRKIGNSADPGVTCSQEISWR
jgi:DNA-binding CsgD family transcriptional regulator